MLRSAVVTLADFSKLSSLARVSFIVRCSGDCVCGFMEMNGRLISVCITVDSQTLADRTVTFRDRDNLRQWLVTPRSVAAILDVLVRAGAEVDAVDGQGRTALHQAAADKRADVAVELLRVGAVEQQAARGDAVAQYELSLQRIAAGRATPAMSLTARMCAPAFSSSFAIVT